MLAAGIALLAVVNSGADCDQEMGLGVVPDKNCKSNAGALGGLGLGLIIVGMIGFLATVTTTPDDPPPVVTPLPVAPPAPTPPSTTPTPIAQ